MINSTEIMEEVNDIKAGLDGKDVVEKILKIKRYFEDTPIEDWQMDRITDYMLVLCNLMYNLSDLKDYAYVKAESLAEEYKSEVRSKYIELKNGTEKMTDTMAKSRAEEECNDIKEQEIKAGYQARQLKSLYDDSERLINYSQTKIKSLTDNIIRSNIERK